MTAARTATLALAALVALTACAPAGSTSAQPPAPSTTPSPARVTTAPPTPTAAPTATVPASSAPEPAADTALAAVATLTVAGRGPKTGYDRDLFGQRWADIDRNGCDTRNDILRRDLSDVTTKAGTGGCKVLSGTLNDPYTGRTITFTSDRPRDVEIDHVVALSDAWQKGAASWTAGKRLAFANDPLNLLAVDGPSNGAKSDADAATWLPSHRPGRCLMVAHQVAVKAKYAVRVTAAERAAMTAVLRTCPSRPLPSSTTPVEADGAPAGPVRTSAPPGPAGTDPDYGTCSNAKANGAGPYYRDRDPEYAWYRDGDSDGVVCE